MNTTTVFCSYSLIQLDKNKYNVLYIKEKEKDRLLNVVPMFFKNMKTNSGKLWYGEAMVKNASSKKIT